jgi:hypothetical protein
MCGYRPLLVLAAPVRSAVIYITGLRDGRYLAAARVFTIEHPFGEDYTSSTATFALTR